MLGMGKGFVGVHPFYPFGLHLVVPDQDLQRASTEIT